MWSQILIIICPLLVILFTLYWGAINPITKMILCTKEIEGVIDSFHKKSSVNGPYSTPICSYSYNNNLYTSKLNISYSVNKTPEEGTPLKFKINPKKPEMAYIFSPSEIVKAILVLTICLICATIPLNMLVQTVTGKGFISNPNITGTPSSNGVSNIYEGPREATNKKYLETAREYTYAGVTMFIPDDYIVTKELKDGVEYTSGDKLSTILYTVDKTSLTVEKEAAIYEKAMKKKYPTIVGPTTYKYNDINYYEYDLDCGNNTHIYCILGVTKGKKISIIYTKGATNNHRNKDIFSSATFEE